MFENPKSNKAFPYYYHIKDGEAYLSFKSLLTLLKTVSFEENMSKIEIKYKQHMINNLISYFKGLNDQTLGEEILKEMNL